MDNHFEELKKYIKDNLASGHSEDNIKKTLHEHNWDPQMVNAGFESIHNEANHHTPISPILDQSHHTTHQSSDHQDQHEHNHDQHSKNHPKKYKLFRSIADLVSAIKNNAMTFFVSVIGSFFVAGIIFYILFFIFYRLIPNNDDTFSTSTSSFIISTIGFFVAYTVWSVFAHALILSTTSLALKSGAENKKTDVITNFKNAISKIIRVILADSLVSAIAFLPLVLILVTPTFVLISGQGNGSSTFAMIGIPLLVLGAIIWAYIAFIRYSMAPYVALFEPEIPVLKTLERSKHLLFKGGQWFLVKGFFLMLAIIILYILISGYSLYQISSTEDAIGVLFLIVLNIAINGVLTMLYFNRRAVR